MKYTLAIFDMDGTILDTLDDLKDSLNFALSANGFPERTRDEVRSFIGNGVKTLVKRAAPPETDTASLEKILEVFHAHYKEHCADKTRPYPMIKETVEELRKRNIKTAVVSNKEHYGVTLLCEKYFEGLFDAAVGSTDAVRRKPAPDTVNAVLKTLGGAPENAVYIGDSDVDIETAKNAHLDCISVTWGFRSEEFLKEHGATKTVSRPEDLAKEIF